MVTTASSGTAEGVEVGSKYRLGALLAVSGRQADFETIYRGSAAMIRVFRCGSAGEAKILAAGFLQAFNNPHPHLLDVYDFGEGLLEGETIAWIVMERADVCLGNVTRNRLLSEEEVRQLVEGVQPALEYLSRQRLAHADVRASNIYACNERIKLSSDRICAADSVEGLMAQIARLSQEVSPVLQDSDLSTNADTKQQEWAAYRPKYRRYAGLAVGGVIIAGAMCGLLIRSAHKASAIPTTAPAVVQTPATVQTRVARRVDPPPAVRLDVVPKGWAVVGGSFDDSTHAEEQAASIVKAHRKLYAKAYAADRNNHRFVIAFASGLSEAQAKRQLARARRNGAPRSTFVAHFEQSSN